MRSRMISGKRERHVAGYRRRRQAAEIEMEELAVRGWHRSYGAYLFIFRTAPALFSLLLLFPSCAAAGEAEELADLKRMLQELKAENRKLSQRLSTLERAPGRQTKPAATHERATVVATAGAPAVATPA